jgi:hypothetical protein
MTLSGPVLNRFALPLSHLGKGIYLRDPLLVNRASTRDRDRGFTRITSKGERR